MQKSLMALIRGEVQAAGGWLPFDRFMTLALYAPGLGYYANASRKFGHMPESGSDFVTAPELTPYFGRALAVQVRQALEVTGTDTVWEFGAGSGALAEQVLQALGDTVRCYTIVDVSGELRERQQERLRAFAPRVQWLSGLPEEMEGVVLGNEVLDAMPVKLLARVNGIWHERAVVCAADGSLAWDDRATDLRPPQDVPGAHDYVTEIHPQAQAFVRSITDRLLAGARGGACFFVDYGFPQAEYYHPQRIGGTVMCHRAHQADADPLSDVGRKDITAHIDFTGIALAAQEAGDDYDCAHPAHDRHSVGVLGYCTQARFLMNCGMLGLLEAATTPERATAHKLLAEHEMGELFKVLGLYVGQPWDALGFALGDRTLEL